MRSQPLSRRIRAIAATLGCTLLWMVPPSRAFTIEHSEARYADKHFRYELVVTLDAPIDRVDAVLRDYAEYPTLNRRILDAQVLDRPAPDEVTVETTVELCFGWFCRNVTRVERVQESKYVLLAVADPERSDVKFSETRSELSPVQPGATRVKYVTSVVPDFWVPPLAGRRMMLKMLEAETRNLFMSVERKAREPQPPTPASQP